MVLRLRPELSSGDLRSLRDRLKLRPDHRGVNFGSERRLGREATVAPADHVLASDELGIAADSLSDQFGVLDDIAAVSDDSGDQNLAGRKLDVFPQAPLVLMTRVRVLKGNCFGVDL